jgi:hypothetical protein
MITTFQLRNVSLAISTTIKIEDLRSHTSFLSLPATCPNNMPKLAVQSRGYDGDCQSGAQRQMAFSDVL